MRCGGCGRENRAGARFCAGCGAALGQRCDACGHECGPDSAFCDHCGAALPAPAAQPASGSRKPAAPLVDAHAERRHLTVLFCDLIDSTALSGALDPEEFRDVIGAYQRFVGEAIARHDGYIAQYLGDGVLAYFGYPTAREDSALRSVRAALEILATNAARNEGAAHKLPQPLGVRVGIHTGLVVVGEVGDAARHERIAHGETPNIAARVQASAERDSVLITEATYRLVAPHVTVTDLGVHDLRGVLAPLRLYRVEAWIDATARADAADPRARSPLVGRESELALLLDRWKRATDGAGQVVLVGGEAGIGKSHLVRGLRQSLAEAPHLRLEWRASPYHQQSPFRPVIDSLGRALAMQPQDMPAERLDKLERTLRGYRFFDAEIVSLLASLLSIPLDDRCPSLGGLTPMRQRQATLDALLNWLLEESTRQPLLLVIEDLHWIDPSTLELIGLLIEQAPMARILLVLTARTEFRPPWKMRAHLTTVTVNRLSREQISEMVNVVTGGKRLPEEVQQQLLAKTDGVPLFVEELTKTVLESGLLREREEQWELTAPLPAMQIPATLQDSLTSRLDRLSEVREIAQVAAAIGREFSYALLKEVARLPEDRLHHGLGRLIDAELLFQRGVAPVATYFFKHALIQEAAYESALKSQRQRLHLRIADALEQQFPDTVREQPELLANHLTRAGVAGKAIGFWQQAAGQAIQRSAYLEGIAHVQKGLELLHASPALPQPARLELGLRTLLGPALLVTKGYAAPDVEATFLRVRQLSDELGDTAEGFLALRGLWAAELVRAADLTKARKLGRELLDIAERHGETGYRLEAHRSYGMTLLYLAELEGAMEHFDRALALYDASAHVGHAARYGNDPAMVCLCYGAHALWFLGRPEQALARSRKGLAHARSLGHPFSEVQALAHLTMTLTKRRDAGEARQHAEAAIAYANEHRFPFWAAASEVLLGSSMVQLDAAAEGVARMQRGIASYRATGSGIVVTWFLTLLGEGCARAGKIAEGVAAAGEALALIQSSQERYCEPEVHRVLGELRLLQRGERATAEAERCFRDAIAVARKLDAKSWELRAALSLARLWAHEDRCAEARDLLQSSLSAFEEGFESPDLADAATLLARW